MRAFTGHVWLFIGCLATTAKAADAEDAASSRPESSVSEESPERSFEGSLTQVPLPDAAAPPADSTPIEVQVQGSSLAERLQRSPYSLQVVETTQAKRHGADLGDVLARTTNVTVQRGGGLGSSAQFSLNGLGGDRVRFFLDGIPLEYAGYPMGLANVPVNLIERVEVYDGAVPVRFGADALGGAVNLVTDESARRTKAGLSYQVGSYGTLRATLGARTFHAPSGVFVRGAGFYDRAKNDYPVGVQLEDALGRLEAARVRRFHDRYAAHGGSLSVGVVDTAFADRLVLSAFAAGFERDVQSNLTMAIPYGEVTFERVSYGGNARYSKSFGDSTQLEVTLVYARSLVELVDLSRCRYDWRGRCVLTLLTRGEVLGTPLDRRLGTHTGLLRALLRHELSLDHSLTFSLSPTFTTRTGENRATPAGQHDSLRSPRRLGQAVLGAELESSLLDAKLVNSAFLKLYGMQQVAERLVGTGQLQDRSSELVRGGAGDALRYSFTDKLYAKATYEYATRMPAPDELFGDGALVEENLELLPEVSHNGNTGLHAERLETPLGTFALASTLALRFAENLIVPLPGASFLQYQNVYSARVLSAEGSTRWRAPGEWLSIQGQVAYQDVRNRSEEGAHARFQGERVPNQPYLRANGAAVLRVRRLAAAEDSLELGWSVRYVHAFLRGWGGIGSNTNLERQEVSEQLTHAAFLSYVAPGDPLSVTAALDVENLTDARVFDFYGAERPGRTVHFKATFTY